MAPVTSFKKNVMKQRKISNEEYNRAIEEIINAYSDIKLTKKQITIKLAEKFPDKGFRYHYVRMASYFKEARHSGGNIENNG